MIDAERMLGSLVRSALSGKGTRSRKSRRSKRSLRTATSSLGIPKSAIAMGALGTAIAAFEHFSGKDTDQIGRSGAPTPPTGASAAPLPPLPPTPTPTSSPATSPSADLPPLPTSGGARTPNTSSGSETSDEALLLIQAMVAAAHADHDLDGEERNRILDAIDQAGLSDDDRAFLVEELEHPKSLTALVTRATTPDLARQVYLASLMAIDVDSPAEEAYLAKLAERLELSQESIDELAAMLES